MNWSDIMNVIAAAIISAAGSILVLVITIIWNGKKDRALSEKDQMLNGKEHDKLSWEHENLEKSLSKEINAVEKAIMPVNGTTNEIKGILLEEKARQSEWRNNLSGEQKDMKVHIDELNKMADDWQRLITENKDLRQQIYELKRENEQLQAQDYDRGNEYTRNLTR